MANIPSVSELVYVTYDRPLHPELLPGARCCRYDSKQFLTYLYLINLGHMAIFFSGENSVCEVIAPRDSKLPKEGVIAYHNFEDGTDFSFSHKGSINYKVSAKIIKMVPMDFFRKANKVILQQSLGRMVQFYQPMREEPLSFSMIDVKNLETSTLVEAHHFFGRSSTVIRTFSIAGRQNDEN